MMRTMDRGEGRSPHYTKPQGRSASTRDNPRIGGTSRRMLLIWLTLAGFILFFTPQSVTNKLQLVFARIFHLPLSVGRNISLSTGIQNSVATVVSRGIYNRLENHLANVTEQLQEEHKKVEALSGLRNRFALEGASLVYSDVITASIGREHSELIINRGEDDGVAADQYVLSDNSIIGTICDVSPRTAQVRLFTDPGFKIAVKIGSLDIERLMYGNSGDTATVRFLPTKYKVRAGDKVFVLKKPGYLDAAMIIGTVTRCERDADNPSLWDITVKPVCDIERLNNVSVLIMNPSHTY